MVSAHMVCVCAQVKMAETIESLQHQLTEVRKGVWVGEPRTEVGDKRPRA